MTQLTITSAPEMGPLEVSVYPPDGEPVEFTLSSGSCSKSLPALPGRYTVIARRPNGSRLRQTAVVEGADTSVSLAQAVGATPNEFMQQEVKRGEIAPASPIPAQTGLGAPLSGVSADILGHAMLREGPMLAMRGGDLNLLKRLSLRGWRFDGAHWRALDRTELALAQDPQLSDNFLKLALQPPPAADGGPGEVLCLGLLDESGLGPLVILPPFAAPAELTFVAKGVLAQAADRGTTPGQQRVPVALFTPSAHAIADFLSALAAPATPSAETLWNQAAPGLAPGSTVDVAGALEVLLEKYRWPAEALVAAHYLLRFLPNRLPLQWAENLVRAMPLAADGPVIAAWAWIYNRPRDATDAQVDAAVARNVSLALGRPVTLFARTRALLLEARHLLPADPESESRWGMAEMFRRAGAAASGLESFWGSSPASPGAGGDAQPGPDLDSILLAGEVFSRR